MEDIRAKNIENEKQLATERKINDKISRDFEILRSGKSRLNEDILDLQSRSMRDNLLLFNIPECTTFEARKNDEYVKTFNRFCVERLKIADASEIQIDRAHRVGGYTPWKTRPIVVKYNYHQDKQRVKQTAYNELKKQ